MFGISLLLERLGEWKSDRELTRKVIAGRGERFNKHLASKGVEGEYVDDFAERAPVVGPDGRVEYWRVADIRAAIEKGCSLEGVARRLRSDGGFA